MYSNIKEEEPSLLLWSNTKQQFPSLEKNNIVQFLKRIIAEAKVRSQLVEFSSWTSCLEVEKINALISLCKSLC